MSSEVKLMLPQDAWEPIAALERALANREYAELASRSPLGAEDIREAVEDYGVRLVSEAGSLRARAIVFAPAPGVHLVDLPLVSQKEGKSQLCLFLEVVTLDGVSVVTVEGIGVP